MSKLKAGGPLGQVPENAGEDSARQLVPESPWTLSPNRRCPSHNPTSWLAAACNCASGWAAAQLACARVGYTKDLGLGGFIRWGGSHPPGAGSSPFLQLTLISARATIDGSKGALETKGKRPIQQKFTGSLNLSP